LAPAADHRLLAAGDLIEFLDYLALATGRLTPLDTLANDPGPAIRMETSDLDAPADTRPAPRSSHRHVDMPDDRLALGRAMVRGPPSRAC
jgi:hypothetical protein